MRITEVETVLLTGPSTNDPWLARHRRWRSAAFIEIRTDAGHVGIGETYAGYFIPQSVPVIVDYLKPILVNAEDLDAEDLDIATLVSRMRLCGAYWGRVGLGAAVIAGIEAALWDLKGKLMNLPVHQLLGGPRHQQLPTYATGGPSSWPASQLLEKVDYYLGLGFRHFKVASGWSGLPNQEVPPVAATPAAAAELEVEKAAAIRERFGSDVGILLDGHMGHRGGTHRWDLMTAATVLDALEPYDIFLFEEPLPYTDLGGYAELTKRSAIPVAGGEQLSTYEEFKTYADAGAFAIAQPDAAWLGLGSFIEVARLFAEGGHHIAPHAWGAGAAVMQNVHAAFAVPNVVIVEAAPNAGPLHTEIWGDQFRLDNGVLLPPTAPGLGVNLAQAIKDNFPYVPGSEEFSSVPGKQMRY